MQVVLVMKRSSRDGKPLQHAAARAALWLLNDLPAFVESILFPDSVSAPVRMPCCIPSQMPSTARWNS